jgi:hypothetical protein
VLSGTGGIIVILGGAIAAIGSLAAGLIKTLISSKERKSESVTVTVQRGGDTIEKKGMLKPDDATRILDMVDTKSSTTVNSK